MVKKVTRVLLFIPPVFTFKDSIDINPLPPLGLAYLGAVLENKGVKVRIFDSLAEGWENITEAGNNVIQVGSSFGEIKEIIRDYCPDIVGVNSLFTVQRKNAHEIYKLAKEVDRGIITIAGGAHPTVMPMLALEDENLDFVVLGEGEETILDLVRVIEGQEDISNLNGVGYRKNKEVKIIPKTKFIEDLDKVPFPARHLLNMERYMGLKASHGVRNKKRFSPVITSRGCPAQCTFCSAHMVWGRKFRSRSPENVIAEIKDIKERYAIEEIMLEDDNATFDVKRAEKIFDLMVKEKLNLAWDTPNGVAAWNLTEGLIRKIKESGCSKLNFPIETGNQYIMDNILRKPLQLEKVKPLVKYARKIGLNVGMFLIIGMPEETEGQIWDTFRIAKELEVYFPHISIATPYPGSELYDICIEKKYFSEDFSLDDLFIRGFCISTKYLSSDRLKKVYAEGQVFLLKAFFKRHPFKFIARAMGIFFSNPGRFARLLYKFMVDKKDLSILR